MPIRPTLPAPGPLAANFAAALPAAASSMQQVLGLAWPVVAEQLLLTLVGLVDAYIVGHLGAEALAGVGMGSQVVGLTVALFAAVGVGGTVLVARHIGAREPGEANHLARQALLLAVGLGLAATVAALVWAEPIVAVFGAEPGAAAAGSAWLRVVAPSFTLLAALLVGTAVLRGAGDTRTPLLVMAVVNLVNISAAWSFTRGLAGLPRLGIVGSGLGALTGHAAGGLLVVLLLARGRRRPGTAPHSGAPGLVLGWHLPRPDTAGLRRILNVGLPAGAEQLLLQLALLNLSIIIARFGTTAYAAHLIGLRISAIAFLPGWGFGVAATTLVGQALGAGRPQEARAATYSAFWLALVVMVAMAGLLLAFSHDVVRAFTPDVGVVATGGMVIRMAALAQPAMAAAFVFSGALRGAGDTRATMVIGVASMWGLRLLAAYGLGVTLGLGLAGAWLAIGLDFSARGLLLWLRFHAGRWTHLKI